MPYSRKCLAAALFLFGASVFPSAAGEAWSPYPMIGRDTAVVGIAVSDHRVLAASRTNLYELDETQGIWKSARPITSSASAAGVQSLAATPSAHFIQQQSRSYILRDSSSSIPAPQPDIPFWSQSVSEDSTRFYLRLFNGSVIASDKAKLSWDTLNITTLPGPFLNSSGRFFTARHDLTGDGLYQSDDLGKTWKPVPDLPESYVSFVKPLGNDLYIGLDGHGIFHSADGGSHWSSLFPNSFPYASYSFVDIDVAGDSVWLVTHDSRSQGVLRTVDAGRTWRWFHQGMPGEVEAEAPGGRFYPVLQLARGAGALWAMDWTTKYRSEDGGQTWRAAANGLPQSNGFSTKTLVASGFSGMTWAPAGFIQIGKDFSILGRTETGDFVYVWSEGGNKWTRDLTYPDTMFTWLAAMGDTVYVQVGASIMRRVESGGPWKSITLPWQGSADSSSQWVTEVFRMGSQLAILGGGTAAGGLYFSDDEGKTWDVQRHFLPKALFQGSRLEGRGQTLCWPDDGSHSPPKIWREFPEPIRGIWVAEGKLLVRAGPILYSTASVGGVWTQTRLPDTSMVLAMRNGALTGYTLDSLRTYSHVSGVWQTRPVRFPYLEVNALAAGPEATWAQTDGRLNYRKVNGEAGFLNSESQGSTSVLADAGSYLMVAQNRVMDTLNIATIGRNTWALFFGRMQLPVNAVITGLLGGGDFMAIAYGETDFLISRDRGQTWSKAAKPPGRVSKLAGTPDRMFALADSLLYASIDSAKTWTPLSASGLRFTSVAGNAAFLAALSKDRRSVLISADTGRSWTALPALSPLPPGADSALADVAVSGRQVLVGTRDAGVFIWGDPAAISISLRPPGVSGSGIGARTFRREWIHLHGQGLRLRLNPNSQVDARGRLSMPAKPLSGK